jgi:gluconolactonase
MSTRLTLFTLIISCSSLLAADDFPITDDSKPQPNVAKGTLTKDTYLAKADSLFPGTEREYQIYLPAGLDSSRPAPFMVFQDGVIYQAPTVFDNLIAKKDIPPVVGIFIKPGIVPAANDNALPRFNRSYEYDSVTDHYARFLIDEFLPAIVTKHKLNLSSDPNARAIAGNSSGGICAFMVAWHRPDQFRRVFTGVGTYVGIHGADQLPVLVRKHEPKPLRVFLQSGEKDNDLYCGDWWMANQMMERSLTWNGYEVSHAWGKGGHNAKHATQIFPDVMRWLWKGYPDESVKANPRQDAKWRGYGVIGDGVWEPHNGEASLIRAEDKLLKRHDGLSLAKLNGPLAAKLKVEHGAWSPDQTQLYLNLGSENTHLYTMKVGADGVAQDLQPFYQLQADESGSIQAGGLCVDTNGWLYVATSLGVQVLDQCGRVNFIITTPKQPRDVCFGGRDLTELYISCGDTSYKRQTTARGCISGETAPIKPPAPKL